MRMLNRLLLALAVVFGGISVPSHGENYSPLPSLDEALKADADVWGLAAMKEPNGANYQFFERLLPPLRYVNADFHYYPITLAAPNSPVKARLTSNGSSINALAGLKTWKEAGTPVHFSVGPGALTLTKNGENKPRMDTNGHESEEKAWIPFGQVFTNIDGPRLEGGWMPIVTTSYTNSGDLYREECFAGVGARNASNGVVYVRFKSTHGLVRAAFPSQITARPRAAELVDTNGAIVAWFSKGWHWKDEGKTLVSSLETRDGLYLALATRPIPANSLGREINRQIYETERRRAMDEWRALVEGCGTSFIVPEKIVNDCSRALIAQNYSLIKGNAMNYSAGNAYDRLYQAECGDAVRALVLFGQGTNCSRLITPLLKYTRDSLKYHNAGFKLQTLSHYYWLTRDSNYLRQSRDLWKEEINKIVQGREAESGMFPRESYCGDIATKVYSLHSNGASWRGLRDFSVVLDELGDQQEAERLRKIAAEFRVAILAATAKSERTDVQPPFIPVALFGEEKPYEHLTSSMLGSYWDLIAPYMLGSGIFGPGSAREKAILGYLQQHGGIFMGMIRFDQHSGLFANTDAVDDLYGLRYTLKLLQTDQPDAALVSFYGKLAQGLTRDTFVGAEGTGLRPVDNYGRPMYLPPNSASDAFFLCMLRYLLVQDWDLDDDGRPETLRLAFATPRQWLVEGCKIEVTAAPTAFGPVSYTIQSHIKRNEIEATLDLPLSTPARHTYLRVRVPDGVVIKAASVDRRALELDSEGTMDLSDLRGKVAIRLRTTDKLR
jgi:hypothetical protein